MVYADGGDPFAEFKAAHRDYRVYDTHYESLGHADELFVDEEDRPLYVAIRAGVLETKSIPVPLEVIRINDKRRVVAISADADRIRHAPKLGENEELTPDLEDRIHNYFGLITHPLPEHERASHPDPLLEKDLAPDARVDLEPGERLETAAPAGEATPPRARETETPREAPPKRAEQVSPPREPGKEWARGTERLPVEDGTADAVTRPRAARTRRFGT